MSLKLESHDSGFEDEVSVYHSLDVAADAFVAFPDFLADDVHSAGGDDLHAEAAVLDAAEADEALPADEHAGVEGGELGTGFEHEDAGEEGAAGDMAGDPEFVGADVFEADDSAELRGGVDDAVEHFHVAPLWIGRADGFLVVDDGVEIDAGQIEEKFGGHWG